MATSTDAHLPTIDEVLRDPSTSVWLSLALQGALRKEPVDVANDAEVLFHLLERRCDEYTPGPGPSPFLHAPRKGRSP